MCMVGQGASLDFICAGNSYGKAPCCSRVGYILFIKHWLGSRLEAGMSSTSFHYVLPTPFADKETEATASDN